MDQMNPGQYQLSGCNPKTAEEFLLGYTIPKIDSTAVEPNTAMQEHARTDDITQTAEATARFVGPRQRPAPRPSKRPSEQPPNPVAAALIEDGQPAVKRPLIPSKVEPAGLPQPQQQQQQLIFQGRNANYPDALNQLLHPYHCELCNVRANSMRTAGDHYNSKPHTRRITDWLQKHCPEKSHLVERNKFAGIDPHDAAMTYCSVCNLQLTSPAHAHQHYSGRKHNFALSKKVGGEVDSRFGIGGDQFQSLKKHVVGEPAVGDVNSSPAISSTELCCSICKICVTSHDHMASHLAGGKHRKKLQMSSGVVAASSEVSHSAGVTFPALPYDVGVPPPPPPLNPIMAGLSAEALQAVDKDAEMFRTPSGLYYCSVCNISFNNVSVLKQHIIGKRHRRMAVVKPSPPPLPPGLPKTTF